MKRDLVTRMARWSARHAWWAISIWALFVVAAILGGSIVGTRSVTDDEFRIGESGRAEAIVSESGLEPPATESVLVSSVSGELAPAADYARAIAAQLRTVAGVAEVGEPVTGSDGATVLVPVTLSGDPATAEERIDPLLDAVAAAAARRPDLRVEQVGGASIDLGVQAQLGKDFQRAELFSVPVTLLILVIAFGALVAAGVPIVLALTSVGAAIGLSSLVSHLVPDGGTTANMILLMGMAVGIDYSMFYLRRQREERARGHSATYAVEIAAATAGRAAVVSGIAVIASVAGLFLADDATFASLATGTILVVLVAVLGCLTVLPALLAKLGTAVDWPRNLLRRRDRGHNPTDRVGGSRLWSALLRPALRRPAWTLGLSTLAMLGLAVPMVGLTLASSGVDSLPDEIPAVLAYDRLVAAFPTEGDVHVVAVTAPPEQKSAVQSALARLGDPADIRASADGRTHVMTVPANRRDAESARLIRAQVATAFAGVPGAEAAVGGGAASSLDYAEHQRQKLPWVIGFVLALTFVVMLFAFRSVVLAAVSIAVNALSCATAFGVLVLVFQNPWAEGLLGFTSTGSVVSWIPLFLFVVLFGLSMDYHILVLSRVREAARRGLPTKAAVAEGVTASAPVVTSAAIVMVAVFAIFASLSLIEFKQIGVGLGVAVLLDVAIVRVLILPAAMALLGDRVWWPGRVASDQPAPRVLVEVASAPAR